MNEYIALSELNDFIFCPYSIYLHQVYWSTDEETYKALPQIQGTMAHEAIDNKTASTRKDDLLALPVISHQLGLTGKIDLFRKDKKLLIERKNHIPHLFRGQIYQLWAQYFCMKEMGYEVESIAFYDISANKMWKIDCPNHHDFEELQTFLERFRDFNPETTPFKLNLQKCMHCVYCNLCDKTDSPNVYT